MKKLKRYFAFELFAYNTKVPKRMKSVCLSAEVERLEERNAELLEAANVLLDAVLGILPYVPHLPDNAPIKEAISAAINKAKKGVKL